MNASCIIDKLCMYINSILIITHFKFEKIRQLWAAVRNADPH